ncbi:hypothetical protein EMIHUDRAFT_253090 [Emiliania huxleyi CCMP1516]|uniref:SCD domain-containing protein n=2 Tax=Emiliania huxleyi TaxID=2903 RepID=A0A0D3KCY0_EMIH1|nr:hypothetical protein EMIHUDRAFT_253090 [Emiliania huxleyi CCMP1516]EOD33615.1 hypothetical protein EMIHUDRAFT_253090 [Emiliania huxleyi CCMP1516]|eukprot:XP_005786044.1 hypothetical protein EMIHUDRAFT_253090 [Emiliania huxleyi CCMP1516]
MALMVRMTELAVELATQATAKQRQASKPGKKGGAGMAAILKEEVQRLQENETALEEMVTAAFPGMFTGLFVDRDSAEEVRTSCLSALGRVMQLHPSMFLADTYLKYLGWSLSDMAAAVRAASLSQLSAVYTAHGAAEEICRVDGKPVSGAKRLLNFTRRFESRFIEMTRDVDAKAQAVSEAGRVMRNNEPSQLEALVPLEEEREAAQANEPPPLDEANKAGKQAGVDTDRVKHLADTLGPDPAGEGAEER